MKSQIVTSKSKCIAEGGMTRTTDVEFIVDKRGRKKSVVMGYRTYQRLMEDIADLQSIEDRKLEKPESLESVIAELKDAGRL